MAGSILSVTSKGKRWELLHSLWIGWTFTLGFFNWIAFLYIGIRANRRRWVLYGVLYSLPFILAMALPDLDGWPGDLVVALTLIMGVGGIVHAFRIRKDYLRRIAKKQHDREVDGDNEGSESSDGPEDKDAQPSKEDSLLSAEELLKICIKYVADGYYVDDRIPENKLSNAKYHFPVPSTERVIALIDSTIFGSNKAGLAICDGGVYWRNDWSTKTNRNFLSWDEFASSGTVAEEETYKAIQLAEGSLFNISGSQFKKSEAIELLREVQSLAQSVTQPSEKFQLSQDEKSLDSENYEQLGKGGQTNKSPTNAEGPQTLWPDNKQDEEKAIDGLPEESIPQDYPIPLSYAHRLIEAEFESLRILKETYRNAEGLTAFLASLSLALLGTPTGKTKKQLLNAWRGKGATFGNWYSILSDTTQLLKEDEGPLHSSLKGLFSPESHSTFAEDMRWLIDRRDELHHRDLPVGKETDLLISETCKRLERCIKETASLWEQNPLRLILDYDAIRNSDWVVATCLDYSGDHPAGRKVREKYKGVPKKQDLYILQNGSDWLSLYPFISVHYCSHCSARETYFVDGWVGGEEPASLRSFERAHEETSQEIGKALAELLNANN
jgi:hypothetical protein